MKQQFDNAILVTQVEISLLRNGSKKFHGLFSTVWSSAKGSFVADDISISNQGSEEAIDTNFSK